MNAAVNLQVCHGKSCCRQVLLALLVRLALLLAASVPSLPLLHASKLRGRLIDATTIIRG
jgi:hypothetical protein